MQTRKFDELISYFNRKVAEINIDTKYKMELLGMVTALGLAHEKELTAQPEQRWIPVTERLPKDDTVVLVCGRSGGVYTAIHNNSKTWIRGWWKMNSKNHHCNPTAWMPLPAPYEEGEPK